MSSASCCFLLVFYIAGNQYQTESKRTETFCGFSGPEGRSWAMVALGGTNHQGVPGGPNALWWVVPTSGAPWTDSLLYKYPNSPKTLGESGKINSSRRKFQKYQIQSRHHHRGVYHVHWCLSDDA